MAGASLSDLLSAIQNGVIALNNLGSQITGSLTNILGRIDVLATPACFSANKGGSNQTLVADSVLTAVTFGTELYDIGSHFAANGWTPPSGKVHISTALTVTGTIAAATQFQLAVFKNGAIYKHINAATFANAGSGCVSFDDIANGTDIYTVQMLIDVTAGTGTISGSTSATYFTGHWFSA